AKCVLVRKTFFFAPALVHGGGDFLYSAPSSRPADTSMLRHVDYKTRGELDADSQQRWRGRRRNECLDHAGWHRDSDEHDVPERASGHPKYLDPRQSGKRAHDER